MKRIIRKTYLSPEEAEKYKKIREEVEKDLPDLIKQYHQREKDKNKQKEDPLKDS